MGRPHVVFSTKNQAKWVRNTFHFMISSLHPANLPLHEPGIWIRPWFQWKESCSSEPKCLGTMLERQRWKEESHRLVGSAHLPNWKHSNYWSQIKQTTRKEKTAMTMFETSTRHGTVVKQWLNSPVVRGTEGCSTSMPNTGNLRYRMVQSKVKHVGQKYRIFHGNARMCMQVYVLSSCKEHETQ